MGSLFILSRVNKFYKFLQNYKQRKIALIERPKYIKLKYYNEKNKEKIENLTEVKSRIVQHEMEHLEGLSFIEKKQNTMKLIAFEDIYQTDEIFENWYFEQKEKNYFIT